MQPLSLLLLKQTGLTVMHTEDGEQEQTVETYHVVTLEASKG